MVAAVALPAAASTANRASKEGEFMVIEGDRDLTNLRKKCNHEVQ
jgi:hypothetical protein